MADTGDHGKGSLPDGDVWQGSELLYRPLRSGDLASLRALLDRAVPDDYLLPMAAEWMAGGITLGGWRGSELLSVLRLDDLGDGEGWLGGLRVAPEFRKGGLGKELMHYTHKLATRRGFSHLRMFIEEENVASQRLSAAVGYAPILTLCHFAGQVTAEAGRPTVVPLSPEPPLRLGELPWLRSFGGFLSSMAREGYRLVRATPSRLRVEAEAGTLFRSPTSGAVFVLSTAQEVSWAPAPLRALFPLQGTLGEILDGACGAAGTSSLYLDLFLPPDPPVLSEAARRGLVRGVLWGNTVHLFERALVP